MGHYSIHFSPTGGIRRVADILVEGLQGEYQQIDLCHEIDSMVLNEGDVCLVSVPSYGGRVPAIAIDRLKRITGNGAWEDTLTELQDTLEGQGFVCVAALATVAEHSIFRQFAAGLTWELSRESTCASSAITVEADRLWQHYMSRTERENRTTASMISHYCRRKEGRE